jgi:polar amino acid transport system substrate-binding protein
MLSLKNIVVLIFLIFCGNASAAQTLTFSSLEDGRATSVVAEKVLFIAYAKLGFELRFSPMPPKRAEYLWETKQLDGISVRVFDPHLHHAIKVNVPVTSTEIAAFIRDKNLPIRKYVDLKQYRVGHPKGFTIFEERLKEIPNTAPANDQKTLFKLLAMGKTDVVVDASYSRCAVKKLELEKEIFMLEPTLEKVLGYHYLHARHQHLLTKLEKELKALTDDGTIQRIQEQTNQMILHQCH